MGVRILLADDSPDLLDAVRDVLDSSPDLSVVATATSGAATLAAAREHAPDLVVVDVEMPGGGPSLARRLVTLTVRPRVLVLSARDDEETVLSMLAAGASAYLAKGALDEDLATCVSRCAAGVLLVEARCADRVRDRIGELWAAHAGSGSDALSEEGS